MFQLRRIKKILLFRICSGKFQELIDAGLLKLFCKQRTYDAFSDYDNLHHTVVNETELEKISNLILIINSLG